MARRLAAAALMMLAASIAFAGSTDWKALTNAYGRLNTSQRPEFVKILVRKSPAHAERAVRNLVSAFPADAASITTAAKEAAPGRAMAIEKAGKAHKMSGKMHHHNNKMARMADKVGMHRHSGAGRYMTTDQKVKALAALPKGAVAPAYMQLTAAEIAALLKS